MKAGFYLLGPVNCNNPNAINEKYLYSHSNTTYLGSSDDVRAFIKMASCIVLPSYYKEGLPRILLEAMAMGKPIITTNTNGCKELIKIKNNAEANVIEGENGFLIKARDVNALKTAMELFIESKNKEKMGIESIKESKKYNINNIIEIYKNALKELKISNGGKILFISNSSFSIFNFRINILIALKNLGYTIYILAPFDKSTKKLKSYDFSCININIDTKSINPIKNIKLLFETQKIIKNISPNCIFTYTIKPVIYGSLIANYYNIPNIAIITGLGYIFIEENDEKIKFKRLLKGIYRKVLRVIITLFYKKTIKKSNQVWLLNNDDKNELIKLNVLNLENTKVLYGEGVDLNYFNPNFIFNKNLKLENKEQKKFLTSNINEIKFLLIARMIKDKGIYEFIQASNLINAKNSN